ncbi:MAG: 4-hydroxyproline epimerase [Paraburkholderia sp.]|nr:4-hydroxyproline epimerase [Paraburkholderia sp.]
MFEAHYDTDPALPAGQIRPRIRGTAHVNAESRLLFSDDDPFAWGIRAA